MVKNINVISSFDNNGNALTYMLFGFCTLFIINSTFPPQKGGLHLDKSIVSRT